jgi:hypothetical protein
LFWTLELCLKGLPKRQTSINIVCNGTKLITTVKNCTANLCTRIIFYDSENITTAKGFTLKAS